MSAVTLQEIADLVAGRLGVSVSQMRGLMRGRSSDDGVARRRMARNIVVLLARRHTQASYPVLAGFFHMVSNRMACDRMSEMVRTAEPGWLSADPELHWAVEEIEQQIDALHERRMTARDRKAVRV